MADGLWLVMVVVSPAEPGPTCSCVLSAILGSFFFVDGIVSVLDLSAVPLKNVHSCQHEIGGLADCQV